MVRWLFSGAGLVLVLWSTSVDARELPDCEEVLAIDGQEPPPGEFPSYQPVLMPGAWGGVVGCYMGQGEGRPVRFYGERLITAERQDRLMSYGDGQLAFRTRPEGSDDDWRIMAACTGPISVPWRCDANLTFGGGPFLRKVFDPEGTLIAAELNFSVRDRLVPPTFVEAFEDTAASNRAVVLSLADGSAEWRFRPDEPGGNRFVLSLGEHPDVLEALYRPSQALELRVDLDRLIDGRRQEITFRREVSLTDLRLILTHLSQMEILTAAGFEGSKEISF